MGIQQLPATTIIQDPATPANQVSVNASQAIPIRVQDATSTTEAIVYSEGGEYSAQSVLFTSSTVKVYNAASGNYERARAAVGTTGIQAVNTESTKATYKLAGFVTPAAAPTDVINIQGSATKTVRITRIAISVESTASGIADVALIKRSAANTAGTSSSPTIAKADSADGAATAVVLVYTANPTGVGATAGNFGAKKVAGTTFPLAEWVFSAQNDKACVLKGTSEYLSINGNGDTLLTGEVWAYDIEWTEE